MCRHLSGKTHSRDLETSRLKVGCFQRWSARGKKHQFPSPTNHLLRKFSYFCEEQGRLSASTLHHHVAITIFATHLSNHKCLFCLIFTSKKSVLPSQVVKHLSSAGSTKHQKCRHSQQTQTQTQKVDKLLKGELLKTVGGRGKESMSITASVHCEINTLISCPVTIVFGFLYITTNRAFLFNLSNKERTPTRSVETMCVCCEGHQKHICQHRPAKPNNPILLHVYTTPFHSLCKMC